jgi:EAL domain-containing protein (putative c-di-GMP-specific phosphodiesterase class I)
MSTVRARTTTFLVLSALAVGGLIVIGLALEAHSAGGDAAASAELRAGQSVKILVTIGAKFPALTERALADGLPDADGDRLAAAVEDGRTLGLLSDLVVWDRTGHVAYTSSKLRTTKPGAGVWSALDGRPGTSTQAGELDPTTGRQTGLVDTIEPLVDATGRIYGAIQADVPLAPMASAATQAHHRSQLLIVAGAAGLWLLLLPLWVRLARSQAKDWIPGRRRLLRAFRRALDRDAIELVYQAQIDPSSRRVHGVEALVRWRRNGQLCAPDQFLPAVESSPLMARLTDRVLDLALAQQARWRAAGIVIRMSVNLSGTDLADDALPQRIADKLDSHGVMGQDLTVEVTETMLVADDHQARLVLTALDRMGIDIAIDDFGTGHASISRLHSFPVSELKIDRSFVSDTGLHSRKYLAAMVGFGRGLGLRVVAEGVEDDETLVTLATLECDVAQGYLISRPLERAPMTQWLTTADPAGMLIQELGLRPAGV